MMKVIATLEIGLLAAILVVTQTFPGLGFGWSGNTLWTDQITASLIMMPLSAGAAAMVIYALMSRAWRLLLPAIAGIVFVSGAEAPFTLHAPILTDINQIDETPIDRSLVVDLTFPELATHLQGASVTMTWEGMMPILVAAEAADVRAKLLADEIMRLVSGEEELQKIGGFLAPETDERDQLVENLAVAVDRRSHLLSLPPIPPCRRFGEERANGPWNEECRFRREFRQNEISRLERSISDFEARLDISQRALEEQANTYRAILAASDEGARLLAYRRDAYAKAQEVSQTRVISLLVVGLIAISAITVPKIGWAVGVVAVAVGAQIWMLPAASGWARFEPFVHFATFAVPFMIARLIHDAIVTNWPLLRLSRPAEWWSALKLMAMRSVWIVVGAGLLFSASFYLDKYSGDILYGLQVRPNISNIDVVAGCTIGETLVFRQPTLEGCAVRRSESDIEASIDWRLAEGERQALLRIDEKANDASSTTAQIGEATISAFDDFVPRFLAADQGGSGNNESYVSTGFNKWNCSINPFKWLGCLVNKMLAPPRNGYVATYENARNKLLTHVTTAVEEANGDIEVARATMKVSVRQSRIEMQENTHQAINTIFRWLDVIGLAAIFIFTLTVLRLFAHIFLRCFLGNTKYSRRIELLRSAIGYLPGSKPKPFCVEQIGSEAGKALLNPGKTYRIRREYGPANLAAKFIWPRVFFAPRGGFREYNIPPNSLGAAIKLPNALRGVTVTLEDGQRLAFDQSAFLGYSGDIRFRKVFRQSLINLLSGRLRTLVAVGVGEIILLSTGEIEKLVGKELANKRHIQVHRMLAWSHDVQFMAQADVDTGALYVNAPYVRPLTGGLVVADEARHSRKRPPLVGMIAALLSQV